jgi:hypothetical protein
MAGRVSSSRARADHVRELARTARDERTQLILLDIARALEAEDAAAADGAPAPRPVPRSLS